MTGDDAGVGVHQSGAVKAELSEARSDLRNLAIGVDSGILGVTKVVPSYPPNWPPFRRHRHSYGGREAPT